MKTLLRLLVLLPVFAALPAQSKAADVSGTWKGSFDAQGTTVPLTIHLSMDGTTVAGKDDLAKVTGTVEGLKSGPAEIHDGILHGDNLSFWLNTDYQGQTYKLVYKGKVAADQISFDFGTEDGSWSTSLTVKRSDSASAPPPPDSAPAASVVPDVTGDWTGTLDANGTPTELRFHLKSSGNIVTGTLERSGAPPVEIHDGKIEGNTVSFWITTDYEGQSYTIVYKGKITPGQIDFDLGTADQSWGAQLTVKKS